MTSRASLRGAVVTIVTFALACAAIFVVEFRAGGGHLPGSGGYEFQAVVPDAVALAPGSKVRSAGVVVGQVTGVERHDGNAVVMARLQDEHAPVYANARVQVRLKSLVGENYLDVDRGTAAAKPLSAGGVLPIANADDATQLDQILSVLDTPTRAHLRTLIKNLGAGLKGRGSDANRVLAALAGTTRNGGTVASILASQRDGVAQLVDDLGTVMRAVASRDRALADFARGARGSAEAVSARDERLEQTLRALPPLLQTARSATRELAGLSATGTPVVDDLATTLDELTPVIPRLASTAATTRRTLSALSAFAYDGRPLLRRLSAFADRTSRGLSGPLDESLAQLLPLMRHVKPYADEAGAFFSNLRSATNFTDATGHMARVLAIGNEGSLAVGTEAQKKLISDLFAIGGLAEARRLGNNQYPKPHEMTAPAPFRGRFDRVEELPLLLPQPPP